MRIGVVEWDVEIVVLLDCPFFLLQLKDLVLVRATAVVPVRAQKDNFTLVRCLKCGLSTSMMRWVGFLVNDEMSGEIGTQQPDSICHDCMIT